MRPPRPKPADVVACRVATTFAGRRATTFSIVCDGIIRRVAAASKISEQALDQIVQSLADGLSQTAVARMHGVSQQAISKRRKNPAFQKRVDAAIRANRRRKRNIELRAARKLRRQQGIASGMRPEPAGPAERVNPTENARHEECGPRPGRLPSDPETITAAPERGVTHPGRAPARPPYRGGGRLPARRARDPRLARLDQIQYDREHGLYECRLRDSGGLEIGYGCFDREKTRKLEAESWEILRAIYP